MKIAQMTGAYYNAGDFLIQERANALLKYVFPSAEVIIYQAKEDSISRFDEINACDAIVIEGGPYILEDVQYDLPLEQYMRFNPPIMMLGVGQYGTNGSKEYNYSMKFTEATLALFKKVTEHGYGISCRDIYTYRALLNENLSNVYMTGCPAWYNLPTIHNLYIHKDSEIYHICVSDPAKGENNDQLLELLSFLEKRYPHAKISYVIHRDVNTYLCDTIKHEFPDVEIVVINGSAEGFSIYDSCDLHIGYRVHAHIYNLSIRNRSILIEEDARGAGVNEALGTIRITAYDDTLQRIPRKLLFFMKGRKIKRNIHVIKELSAYLDVCEQTNWKYVENAFLLQEVYYERMKDFVLRLGIYQLKNT